MSHEPRPPGRYYEERTTLLSQGDIFDDVPLAYPTPADRVVLDEEDDSQQARRFLSGPFDTGYGILITPTCSMRAQSPGRDHAHPVRSLAPLRPIEELLKSGILDEAKLRLAASRDSLINYMYLPADRDRGLVESLALLYMPVTLHHDMIVDQRIAQLTLDASRQLQKKARVACLERAAES
ncbi:MAG: hypothetical protein ACLP50_13815 [Solirubrobacteraceae bacterium]